MAKVFVTAFGHFPGVDVNPTEQLVKRLQEAIGSEGGAVDGFSGSSVLGTEVMEVSAGAVDACLEGLYSRLARETGAVVVVHLGVNTKSAGDIHLECQAVNEATFRVPDTSGWQPAARCIDDRCSLGAALCCELPLQAIADRLQDYPVKLSQDAGRYVCNYCYYQSLRRCGQRGAGSPALSCVFVHLPPFSLLPEQRQFGFLLALLRELRLAVPEPQAAS